jgi:hypothetical protein
LTRKHGEVSHPALFEELLVDSPMGTELMRARDFWLGKQPKFRYAKAARMAAVDTFHHVFRSGWTKPTVS